MTKIDIISGFLGAGKTTFIKKMLDEVFFGEKIVLIENEFGEVGIDGGFLKDAGIEITEMNSGCICCSLVGDFGKSLHEVIDKFHPDRILIEPSGVGKLSDVMKSVIDIEKEDVKLKGLVTVVNALKASKQMKAFGEFFNNQIEHATTVVLSRSQKATAEQLEACVKQIQELNPNAAIITTPWDDIKGEQILTVIEGQDSLEAKMMEEAHIHHHEHHHHDHEEHEHHHHEHDHGEDCTCGCHEHEKHHHHDHEEHEHHHHEHDHGEDCACGCHDHEHHHGHQHHHADEVFTSWGKETPHKYTREKIEKILVTFTETEEYGEILRAKGMVEDVNGSWIYFDMVPGEYELREGEPDYTGRLCVIGVGIDEPKLEELFELV